MNDPSAQPLVVVTPVYEDSGAAGRLFRELAGEFGSAVYVVAVDDGSILEPIDASSLTQAGLCGVVLKLKCNVGHQRAIAIGINHVAEHFPGSRVVVMDSDGEDLPQSIKQLLQPLQSAAVDVVVAQRRSRVETLRFRVLYMVYMWLFRLLTGRKINFGNFMALEPAAVRRLAAMPEPWIHLAGSVIISRLRMALCPLDRGPRYVGKSKMNFVGLALHGFRAVMVFSENVLVRVGIACAVVAGLSVLGCLAAVALKVAGQATPGWFSVVFAVLLLMFLQTGTMTLMMLMLTGVVRGGLVSSPAYKDFVATFDHARQAPD